MKHPVRVLTLTAFLFISFSTSAWAQEVWINEFHYDNDGADTGEFVEVAGPAGTDLSEWTVYGYNGSDGGTYDNVSLSGTIPDQENGFGTVSVSFEGLQNGSPDGIALTDDADALIQFLSYEGTFTATDGPANGTTSEDVGVEETASTPVGESLQLEGTGTTYADFTWTGPATDSPGSVNSNQTLGTPPDVEATRIIFTSVPATVQVNTNFSASLAAVDDEGNVDTDNNSEFSLERGTVGNGQLTSESQGDLILVNFSSGTATVSDLRYDTPEPFNIQALSLSLQNAESDSIVAQGEAEEVTVSVEFTGDEGWRMLSPPFGGLTVGDLDDFYYVQGVEGARPDGEVTVYLDYFGSGDDTSNEFWIAAESVSDNLVRGEGFLLYVFGGDTPFTFDATGVAPTGDVTVATETSRKFHIVGNPFAEDFDLSGLSIGEQTGFSSTVQVWDPNIEAYHLITQGSGSEDIISVWQGFFIERVTVGSGFTTVTFNSEGRVGDTDAPFYGLTAEGDEPVEPRMLGFRLTGESTYDEAARLAFHPEAHAGWDVWDASKLTPLSDTYATLSFPGTRGGGDVLKAQESRPYELHAPVEAPMTFVATEDAGAQFTISWPRGAWQHIPQAWSLMLVDTQTGAEVDLREQPSYTFTAGDAGRTASALTVEAGPAVAMARPLALSEAARESGPRFVLRIEPNALSEQALPEQFALHGNAPNPFLGSTTIRYDLPEDAHVRITVFDALGRQVATLVDRQQRAGADKTVRFDAQGLPSGVYFYRVEAGEAVASGQMVRVR